MKTKIKIILLSTFIMHTSCGQRVSYTTSTNSTSTSTSTTSTSTSSTSCDGIARNGLTKCYYKNLPEVAINGPGTLGPIYWSSATDLNGYGISPQQFSTDATFSVRMIPSYIIDKRSSKQGRSCSPFTAKNFTKMRLKVMLRKSGQSLGETATLISTADSSGNWNYSNTYRYTVPAGTTDPFILEVVGAETDHRCTGKYGSIPSGCTYMDIPLVTNTSYPTECVGFTLQMATDETLDLPN